MKKMKGLPEGMIPDRDNIVYFDTERFQFYIIKWEDTGNNEIPHRHYIQLPYGASSPSPKLGS